MFTMSTKLLLLLLLTTLSVTILASVLEDPGWSVKRINRRETPASSFTNWALDRLNQRSKILDGILENVAVGDLYVIGSGVNAEHVEFGNRVVAGWEYNDSDGDGRKDCGSNQHSTGAASIAIGTQIGIAREGLVVPVKVSCTYSPTTDHLVKGLKWISDRIAANPDHRAVLLFTYAPNSIPPELDALAEKHLVVLPAGDKGRDNCYSLRTISNRDGFMVVGSTDKEDHQSMMSNYGSCIDIFAPGEDVQIAVGTETSLSNTASSTSYAAAAVAGVAVQNAIDIKEVAEAPLLRALIKGHATKDQIQLSSNAEHKKTPNLFLFDICPYYKLDTPGKCYYAQSAQLDNMKAAAKSIITFDGWNYNFYDSCLRTVVFKSDHTGTMVEAVHDREGEKILTAKYIINSLDHEIILESGPKVTLDGAEVDLDGGWVNEGDISIVENKVSVESSAFDEPQLQAIVKISLPDNVTVLFDGVQMISVHVHPDMYLGHTTGLCGFYDNSHVIEFKDRSGESMEKNNEARIVEEWSKNLDCSDCDDCDDSDCQYDSATCQEKAKTVCEDLISKTGQFAKCFETLSSHTWYDNCIDAAKQCCCHNVPAEECACNEKMKYWWAALTENCETVRDCDHVCEKEKTNVHCTDNANGKTIFTYTETITYTPESECYYVDDEHTDRECLQNGEFDLPNPTCLVKTCDTPEPQDMTEFSGDPQELYNCGDEVPFKCKAHECNCFHMLDNPRITCVSDGERSGDWNKAPPTCSLKKCSKPAKPNVNDIMHNLPEPLSWVDPEDGLNCGESVNYHCHECYELDTDSTAKCCNASWGPTPTCMLKTCTDPWAEIESAISGDSSYSVMSVTQHTKCSENVTYSCTDSCYKLEGDETRQCQPDGSWSGTLPKCVLRTCPVLESYDDGSYLFNGEAISDSTELMCGAEVDVTCDDCFYPCTDGCKRVCKWDEDEGKMVWTNDEPKCLKRMCHVREPVNGYIDAETAECGETTTATCPNCYRRKSGDATRTCEPPNPLGPKCPVEKPDGVWDGEELVCEVMHCDELDIPEHVIVEQSCSTNGSCNCVARFKCDSECYSLIGEDTLNCVDGSWDHSVPTCEIKECTVMEPSISRRYIYGKSGTPGACQYIIDGGSVQPDDKIECGKTVEVEAIESNCWHVCNDKSMTCTPDGTWDIKESELPNCVEMECSDPPVIPNTELVDGGKHDEKYNCNSTAVYRCSKCHELVGGSLTLQCTAKDIVAGETGEWVGDRPVCQKMSCSVGDLVEILNGTIKDEHNVQLSGDVTEECPAKVRYTCNECSALHGSAEALCRQVDLNYITEWITSPPSCDPVCCDHIESISSNHTDYDAIATKYSYMHGPHHNESCPNEGLDYVCQEIRAECDECFEFYDYNDQSYSGEAPSRRCVKDPTGEHGVWTNTDKMCTRKQCPVRTIPAVNHLHYKEESFVDMKLCNQTVILECDECYSLSEERISEAQMCTPEKEWNAELPVCTPVTCGEAPAIENGNVTQSHGIKGSTCDVALYQCNPCYRLVGENTLHCTRNPDNGQTSWSSAPPVCEPVCCERMIEDIDETLQIISTKLSYREGRKEHQFTKSQMSVQENFENCDLDYVCQTVEPECEKCFEYTGEDGRLVGGATMPPARQCHKTTDQDGIIHGEWTNKDKKCTLKKCNFREIAEEMHAHYTAPLEYSADTSSYCSMTVTLECDVCHELADGSLTEEFRCQEDKSWSKPLPTCHRSKCTMPPRVGHCAYLPGENLCDHERKLTCDECYYEEHCKQENAVDYLTTHCFDHEWTWVKEEEPVLRIKTCEEPADIPNGHVVTDGLECGDHAKYTCDKCYKFVHDADCLCEKRQCIADPNDCTRGIWNETAPVCEMITCPQLPPTPTHGELIRVDPNCGGQVEYSCDEGYEWTNGDLIRECTELGTWSGAHPICTIKKCTQIGESEHRHHFPKDMNTYETVVQFTCDTCYEFEKNATDESIKDHVTHYPRFHWLACESSGNWNGSAPTCRRKTCQAPPIIKNGYREGSSLCGDSVTYTCDEGYQFAEASAFSSISLTCGENGWSRAFPECVPVDCGEVDVNSPLQVEDPIATTYGFEVEYYCADTYRPKYLGCYETLTISRSTCEASGEWEPVPEQCVLKYCPPFPEIPNGQVRYTKNYMGDTECGQMLEVVCDPNFSRKGDRWISCKRGSWSADVQPRCEPKTCPIMHSAPGGAKISPSADEQEDMQLVIGTKLTWKCDPCQSLDDDQWEEVECVLNKAGYAAWNPPMPPTCSSILCDLGTFANGKTSPRRTASCGSTIDYSCHEGYRLVEDEDEVTCGVTGELVGTPPRCELISCEDIFTGHEDENLGMTFKDPWLFDSETVVLEPEAFVYFDCSPGYRRIGSRFTRCGWDGEWTDEIPTCESKGCGAPPELEHGKYTSEGNTKKVTCDTCYQPTNKNMEIECRDGDWIPIHSAQCEVVRCVNPGQIENGRMVRGGKTEYTCNDAIEWECENENFELVGNATRVCDGVTGTWTGENPVCKYMACPDLPKPEHGTMEKGGDNYIVEYECETGYKMYGNNGASRRQCFQGQWSGTEVTCKVEICGRIGNIQFGSYSVTPGAEGHDNSYGAVVTYRCNDDRFQLEGDEMRECTETGDWSGEAPECICVKCDPLTVQHGYVNGNDLRPDAKVTYECDQGYRLSDPSAAVRTCKKTGEWSGRAPTCNRITCGRPPVLALSTPDVPPRNSYNHADIFTLTCSLGNAVILKCNDQGAWDQKGTCEDCRKEIRTEIERVEVFIEGVCFFGQCEPGRWGIEEKEVKKEVIVCGGEVQET